MPSPLLSMFRSDEEIDARVHERTMLACSALYTGLRANLHAIMKGCASRKSPPEIREFLDQLEGAYHDSLQASLALASQAVGEYESDQEASEVRKEITMTRFRSIGR